MKVYIIMANDMATAAVIGNEEQAQYQLKKHADEFWEMHKGGFKDRDQYDNLVHWHTYQVSLINYEERP